MDAYWIKSVIREMIDEKLVHSYEVMNRDQLVGIGKATENELLRDSLPMVKWYPVNHNFSEPHSAKAWFHGFVAYCFFNPERSPELCFKAFQDGVKEAQDAIQNKGQWGLYANVFCDYEDCEQRPKVGYESGVYCEECYQGLVHAEGISL